MELEKKKLILAQETLRALTNRITRSAQATENFTCLQPCRPTDPPANWQIEVGG